MAAADFLKRLEEQVLGAPRYTGPDVATAASMSYEEAEPLWMELGFSPVPEDQVFFTTADAEVLATLRAVRDDELVTPQVATALTRVLGQALARVANAQAQAFAPAVAEALGEPADADAGAADPDADFDAAGASGGSGGTTAAAGLARAANAEEATALVADVLVPTMERFLSYTWRRHLMVALRRQLDRRPNEVIGFADLVGYTRLTARLPDEDLPEVITRFQHLAALHVTRRQGRVVKLIGDAVMFSAPDPEQGALAALGLVAACRDDPTLPDLRVGLATGPVVDIEGDVYGDTVNRASRLVELARPATVLVDDDTAAHLLDSQEVTVRALRPRKLKGIGFVRASVLRPGRAGP